MRYASICFVLGLVACADPPTPTPKPTPPTVTVVTPLVDARLPIAYRGALSEAPAQRLDLWITPDAILVDERPLFATTPAQERATHWPAGAPTPAKVAGLKAFALDAAGRARLGVTLKGAAQRGRGAADVRLMADRDTPYGLAMDVLGAARTAGFKRWWVRAHGRSKPGDFRTRRARWCTESAQSPTPCTITWALVTTERTWLQNRDSAEAACGVPPDEPTPPKAPLITGPRGACQQLKHTGKQVAAAVVPPHRMKFIKGTRCAYATVAAWPSATWKQAIEIADGLRAAGHATIAFSRATDGETCPRPAPATPASAAPISQ